MESRTAVIALLEPFRTKNFTAPNKFVRSATDLASATDGVAGGGEPGRVAELASGGVGTIISGAAYISRDGSSSAGQWGLHRDERIEDVKRLSAAAHKYGAKYIVQIAHAGGQRRVTQGTAFSPSGLAHPGSGFPTRALTDDGIMKIRADFAAAALRAKKGGADGVQIHGAHGYLITQFLSPIINKRTDKYGGSLENRCRILTEIYEDVRASVGGDFPIWCKISAAEGIDGGYQAEEGLYAARTLLERGIDGIEISSGAAYSAARDIPSMIGVSAGESEAPFKAYSAELKKYSSGEQAITLTGGLRSLPVIAGLVSSGVCDLAGLSRPLIAEPDLINRWYEEDARPAACISCNACKKPRDGSPAGCPVLRDRNEGNWSPL